MNDFDRLVRLQAKRAQMKAALDALDDEIRTIAEPLRAMLKLPSRPPGRPRGSVPSKPPGRPRGSDGMDRVIATLRELGPVAVGQLGDRLGLKRTQVYKLIDRLKAKGVIRLNEQGRYELVADYVPGSEEEGTPSRPSSSSAGEE